MVDGPECSRFERDCLSSATLRLKLILVHSYRPLPDRKGGALDSVYSQAVRVERAHDFGGGSIQLVPVVEREKRGRGGLSLAPGQSVLNICTEDKREVTGES